MNIKRLLSNRLFVSSLFIFFVGISLITLLSKSNHLTGNITPSPKDNNKSVLGSSYKAPQIYIASKDDQSSSGGLIVLASTDEPAITIGGYNVSGTAEISLYKTNDDAVLDYLTHDKENKQIKKTPDESKIQFVTKIKAEINNTNSSNGTKVLLPLSEKGIWYLQLKLGSSVTEAFVIKSQLATLLKQGDNEFIFWGQDFKTKRSLTDGTVILYNLQDSRKELQRIQFNADGIARTRINKDADIALVAQNDERTIVPINLKYLNHPYDYYTNYKEKERITKYFIFTDSPLYQPGDSVNFKAVLRDDDDARYSIPSGLATVKIYNGNYYEGSDIKPIYEQNLSISADGTIDGTYQIPQDGKVGYYSLSINVLGSNSTNYASFNVEFFKKPEFSIEVSADDTELIAGDNASFKITGNYFSGQPLSGHKVKYTVYSADFYEYSYYSDQQNLSESISNDYRYGYWYGSNTSVSGTATLDKTGIARVDLNSKLPYAKGKTQVFSVEATIEDGSLTPSFSRRNILVYAGEYGIYRKDYSYGSKLNSPVSIPIVISPYRNGNVSNVTLSAKLHRESWTSYQTENQKYPSYQKQEEDLPSITATTDGSGNANFTFTPKSIGSYTLSVTGKDSRGNSISKDFYTYISSDDHAYYNSVGDNDLTISIDKQKYQPTDTVKLDIFSYVPNRDVFLSLERGRVDRFQVVHLNGKKGSVEIPLVNTDIPNIYAKASSFDDNSLNNGDTKIPVSPESKKVVVKITPNSKTYGPGETVTVNLETTDIGGNPISSDVALWAIDKAIFEISDNNLGSIFDTFWYERYDTTLQDDSLEGIVVINEGGRGGGCFAKGTKVFMADKTIKNIEDVKKGEYILTRVSENDKDLVKAKVLNTESLEEAGYLTINGSLKVTSNHIMWVNSTWKEAGSIQKGDKLTDNKGNQVIVKSIDWQSSKIKVYNLEVEKYHTYFANGVWVHNDKGITRELFKNIAYWNPSIHTDSSGRAQVTFKLPDNLTTWTLSAVADTFDTKVGQNTNEIVVTKDIIARPIVPNILRVGDDIVLSAIVQNFTNLDNSFDLSLKFDSGDVIDPIQSDVLIKSNEIKQVYWRVKPNKENEKSKLIFSIQAVNDKNLADIVTQEIPVRSFGFEEKKAEAGEGNKNFSIKVSSDADITKSKFILSLSPTITGMLPLAMEYLIDYPYGCVEQTTSRFVPAVIAKINPTVYSSSLKDKNIDDIIKKSIARLSDQQQSDGGWTWWFIGKSDPFITAYVVEYLQLAKKSGAKVEDEVFSGAKNYLEGSSNIFSSKYDIVAKNYALTLLGERTNLASVNDYDILSADILSMAVITNYSNGNTDPNKNGLSVLIGKAKSQGDSVFWEAGTKANFGSTDASTAWAIRAILFAKGDRNIAVKAARYLTRNRKYDYWSNTYATSQVIRALTDLSKTGNELNPSYSYNVKMDGKIVALGNVSSSTQQINDISIPLSDVKSSGSIISVTKNGIGQIYSTVLTSEFHTDKNAKAQDHGLTVKREYINEKGYEYSLGVGDTAIVTITLSGLKAYENYGVITDQLPSGLVPINESFKNEQYYTDPTDYYKSYGVSNTEITENGAVLSLYRLSSGERKYTYKARVVNKGTFLVPPATASLMYAPEIYGRSNAEALIVGDKAEIIPGRIAKKTISKFAGSQIAILISVLVLVFIAIGALLLKRRGIGIMQLKEMVDKFKNRNDVNPPTPPTAV